MNYTVFEELIWFSMGGAVFKFLSKRYPTMSIKDWKKRAKKRYKEIISELEDIGSIRKNYYRAPLSGGSFWIAVYETSQGNMDEETFGDMVLATLESPLMRWRYKKMDPFSLKQQQKAKEMNERIQKMSSSKFNWRNEYIPGRDPEEYTMIFHQCGLCALGKKLGHSQLIPYMCQMDYQSIDLMGGVLFRTQTLAQGGDCCDFYICKKGSKWEELKRQEN